ncbi:hypothetical protein SEA_ATUIN_37 [Arthrobacter phage Atuin]|nr:hypothetical protein SEA_ATUIN_136 [Arthrobacter phage Atuin]
MTLIPRKDTFDATLIHRNWDEYEHLQWVANLVSTQTGQEITITPDHEDPELYTVNLPMLEWSLCTFRSAKNLMYGYQQGHLDATRQH